DIIVGKGVWTAGVLTNILYTERTTPEVHRLFLQVIPSSPNSSSVRVLSGRTCTGSGVLAVADQAVSLAGYSAGAIVYIYVTDGGGIASSTTASDYSGQPLLAKITIPVGGTITESDIVDARCFLTAPPQVQGVSLIPYYLQTVNVADQLPTLEDTFVKVDLGTTVKRSGIAAVALNVITLPADILFTLSYSVLYKNYAGGSNHPDAQARFRVLGGDTTWGLSTSNNVSQFMWEGEPGVGGSEYGTVSWTGTILPSASTTLQLESNHQNSGNQKAKIVRVSVSISGQELVLT
ncbi:MAG: hypothetical protein ACTSWQ_09940, partial [Candidatus Thorarchaeota archaeon]